MYSSLHSSWYCTSNVVYAVQGIGTFYHTCTTQYPTHSVNCPKVHTVSQDLVTHHLVTQQINWKHLKWNWNWVNDPANDSKVTTQIMSTLIVHKGYIFKLCPQWNIFKETFTSPAACRHLTLESHHDVSALDYYFWFLSHMWLHHTHTHSRKGLIETFRLVSVSRGYTQRNGKLIGTLKDEVFAK